MSTSPIRDGYQRLAPYLSVDGAADAIAFYVGALGAVERGERMLMPDGRVGHAELMFADAVLMVADAIDPDQFPHPGSLGGSPVTLHLYVEDVDAVFAAALERGAQQIAPVATQFYGDRSGQLRDPWGHRWNIATHVEDVSDEEMARRVRDLFGSA